MRDGVAANGRAAPREALLWAAIGAVGGLVPVVPIAVAMAVATLPALAVVFVGFLVWRAWAVRGARDARRLRWWTFQAWAILSGIAFWIAMLLFLPPGSDLPPHPSAPGLLFGVAAALVGGSVVLAVGCHVFARNLLAGLAE